MRITDDVFIVGGGATLGFGLSDDPDCHVYLVNGGDELALVDCGMADGRSMDRIAANIKAEGLDLDRLRYLIVTHYHMDHAGGAARFRARFGLEVIAPAGAAPALRTGDEAAVALDKAKEAGFYAPDYVFEPVTVDRTVAEGDAIQIGSLRLEVFDTPGHCAGHASYLLHGRSRRYLFAADAVFAQGRVILQNIHDCSVQQSVESIFKLERLDFDALLPGHGAIVVDDGKRHIALAAAACRQLGVPKNLI
ncbi:MAG: MBL fold metallo-hydrolase [Chloroflexia bacterium]|nr:MBL fold metallo-hydrolase [Chloroflexia bacterium]MDQ3410666.1 MBL fold metallo-hydrolase [Chloroflexota bacterium]